MRFHLTKGLDLLGGFDAVTGWLQELEVHYPESDAVMTLRVVERVTELSEEELAAFEFPDEVVEASKNRPKPAPALGPRRELEKKPVKPRGVGAR